MTGIHLLYVTHNEQSPEEILQVLDAHKVFVSPGRGTSSKTTARVTRSASTVHVEGNLQPVYLQVAEKKLRALLTRPGVTQDEDNVERACTADHETSYNTGILG